MYKKFKRLLFPVCILGVVTACSTDQRTRTYEYATDGVKINSNWEAVADSIIADGLRYVGTPYFYGAQRFQDKNFDCSSYVQYLYNKHGVRLGYNSREQALQGVEIPFDQIRKGDLLFFSDEDYPNETGINKVRHVGIYMGNGEILHTYEPGIGVIISHIHNDVKEGEYWYQHFLWARRVLM